jgi:hypothetical protein
LDIPVFHDDQHGTAIVVLASLLNALRVVGKELPDVRIVITSVGAAGTAVTKTLLAAGARDIVGCDRKGSPVVDRLGLTPAKAEYAELTNPRELRCSANDALVGADVYLGPLHPGAVSADAIRRMADRAIVFAMANPVPEEIEGDVEVIATGRSDYPNQINNLLAFPGVFRGALDVRAREITREMEVAAAEAVAGVVKPEGSKPTTSSRASSTGRSGPRWPRLSRPRRNVPCGAPTRPGAGSLGARSPLDPYFPARRFAAFADDVTTAILDAVSQTPRRCEMTLQLTKPKPQPRIPGLERAVRAPRRRARRHWLWLLAGFPFAFAVPFLLADTLDLDRDLFYGLYALAVAVFVACWARDTRLTRSDLVRNWRWGLALGVVGAAATSFIVFRTEAATDRPGGLELVAAILWRGVLYGATDGVLLSVFPILAVFAAFAETTLRRRPAGKAVIGTIAMLASVGITAVYHLGYADFRSEKVRKPVAGDVIWSSPTLVTLSPFGAPIAHVGLHVSAVVHSSDTDTFLPPHENP